MASEGLEEVHRFIEREARGVLRQREVDGRSAPS
jgi:hypothetical protein